MIKEIKEKFLNSFLNWGGEKYSKSFLKFYDQAIKKKIENI